MGAFFAKLFDSSTRAVEMHLFASFAALMAFIALSAWTVVKQDHPFDGVAFGAGFAALITGTGLAAWAHGKERQADGSAP